MAAPIPENMRAVVLDEYRDDVAEAIGGLKVLRAAGATAAIAARCSSGSKPRRAIRRICCCCKGNTARSKRCPPCPGWEGAGTVIASGGGLLARWLLGKRVACALTRAIATARGPSISSPMPTIASRSRPQLPIEQAASLIVNPLTAMGLLETARRAGHRAAVHTAGASQLGRMMLTMAADMNYPLINVVRRDAQVELLKSRGAKYVLNSSQRRIRQ